jgi:ribose transport system permease protein
MQTPVELAKVTQRGGKAEARRTPLKLQDAGLLLVVATLTLFFYARNPAMLAPGTVRSVLAAASYPALVGLGLVMLMIAGEIDLSTGPVMGACAVVAAWLMRYGGWPAWAGAAGGLTLALAIGLVNGVLTVKLGAPSLVATLAVGIMIRGASYMLTPGVPIYPLAPEVTTVGDMRLFGLLVITVLMLAVLVVVHIILRQTRWGAAIYATGGNRVAAERCGINTDRLKIVCFMMTSLLAGCAGLLVMCQLKAGDPIIGRFLELNIITGVVLGGASFFGGRGSALGTVLGALLVQIIRTGLVLVHVDANWNVIIVGVLLATAAAVDSLGRRRRL